MTEKEPAPAAKKSKASKPAKDDTEQVAAVDCIMTTFGTAEQGLCNGTMSVRPSVTFARCSSMWWVCCCGSGV